MTNKRLTPIAQSLRRNSTEAEKRLWTRLRGQQLGAKFTRQLPIGPYIADFACRSLKLVIECDGGQHADKTADESRTRVIESCGYRVVRFWNNEIMANTDGVVTAIMHEIEIARNQT